MSIYDHLDEGRFAMGIAVWGGFNIGLFEWGALQPGLLVTLAWSSLALMVVALAKLLSDSLVVARCHRHLITQPRRFRLSLLGPLGLIAVSFLGFVGVRLSSVPYDGAGNDPDAFFYWLQFVASMGAMLVLQPQTLVALLRSSENPQPPTWLPRPLVGIPSLKPVVTGSPAPADLAAWAHRMGWN